MSAIVQQSVVDTVPRMPDPVTLSSAAKLSIRDDKPIMMDYWIGSLSKNVIIGVKEDNSKLLVKSEEEYTSAIANMYKSPSGKEYLIATENSIYIVDIGIQSKRISG